MNNPTYNWNEHYPTDWRPSLTTLKSPMLTPSTPAIHWDDPTREAAFGDWLAHVATTHHLDTSSLCVASADASFRRYFRILGPAQSSAIIMDAPPDKEDNAAFVRIAALLREAGAASGLLQRLLHESFVSGGDFRRRGRAGQGNGRFAPAEALEEG